MEQRILPYAPLSPKEYDPALDPMTRRLDEWADRAAQSPDPERLTRELSEFFPVTPLQMILRNLRELGADKAVARALRPFVDDRVRTYAQSLDLDPSHLPKVPVESELPFDLLWCGDLGTGRHLVHVGANAGFVAEAINSSCSDSTFSTGDIAGLATAGMVHDLGKGDNLRILLENPVPRALQGPTFAWNLQDPARKRAVPSPIPLSDEEHTIYDPILKGEVFDPVRIKDFGQLCFERKADYRNAIPVRSLIRLALHVLHHNTLPDEMQEFVDRFLTDDDRAEVKHMTKIFRSQEKDFEFVDLVLARAGIDGWKDTLMSALERHESAALQFVPYSVGCVVTRHHNYESTRRKLGSVASYIPEPPTEVRSALTLADVMSACAEERTYFLNGEPKPIPVIARILMAEAQRYGIPEQLAKEVIRRLLNTQETKEPLRAIFAAGQGLVS